ncbi:hypothetical protein [Nocardioides aequoreus]|uniref:hypothetical protein n=1 Tax=Nocardioides aequoreus TaxID=397278 RepID=UPI0004C3E749|nr:hypothetical protein [Nocardioides aequoreus]
MRRTTREDPLAATDQWFSGNGLAYFVPEERGRVRRALQPRRLVPLLLVVVVLAAATAASLAWVASTFSVGPAVLLTLVIGSVVWYALTALRARSIVGWALTHTLVGVRVMLPMLSRALPLLLLFVTFLFINAEVWQLTASLRPGELWLTVLLFSGLAVAFLLVRLPEEVDLVDDHVDDAFLRRTCAGTPMQADCERLLADPAADPASRAEVSGFERGNLVLALVVVQVAQVTLMAVSVFGFFLLFGGLTMTDGVVESWTGRSPRAWSYLPNLSVELVQVSIFLAAFSALYLTVSTMTDESYREQFFGRVQQHLESAVGVRAVYLTVRDARSAAAAPPPD